MNEVEIIITADGSHSLFNSTLNETYHSVHGAIQESKHVFIRNGLEYVDQLHKPEEIHVLEVGFGTGLNALMTLHYALQANKIIHYTTLEAYPINLETVQLLNYPHVLDFQDAEKYFSKLHSASWEKEKVIDNNFYLYKKKIRIQDFNFSPSSFDLIYFDAFAPRKQPEMWEMQVLEKMAETMKPGGIFVTYCAKGQLKRDLKLLGLTVETLPGPPGKKEMVRAIKN